jgi:glycosyltransferase involved in cell wall biosynthesis
MPRFTVGMPTYNRADLLREALESALSQTYRDVEIIVCDDASKDHTAEVVKRYGHRVRYHRNPTNIGMYPNFAKAIELASGEYCSLLQDDDLIHKDFVRRALEGFARADDVVFYSGFALYSPSPTSNWIEKLNGPPFPVDWMVGESRVIDGIGVVPLLHFINISTYPQIAFRTDVARRATRHLLPNCNLFNENVLMAGILTEGKMVIDPWIGAFHRQHPQQVSVIEQEQGERQKQWQMLAGFFERFLPALPDHCTDSFRKVLEEIPVHNRLNFLNWATACAGDWRTTPPTARALKDLLIGSIPEEQRHEIPEWVTTPSSTMTQMRRFKQAVRRTMPPKMVRIIDAIRS